METASSKLESRENPAYRLLITVHRHGPKSFASGPLSAGGKEVVADYFENAYSGIANDLPDGQGVDVEYSPIDRTEETAILLRAHSGQKIRSVRSDERLSEGMVAHHKELIDSWGGKGGVWMSAWIDLKERPLPDVKTGTEAAAGFAEWVLEKIEQRREEGGEQEIDAISHGPVMLAFMAHLEKELGITLLPEGWQQNQNFAGIIDFLQYFGISANSTNEDVIEVRFNAKTVSVPVGVIRKIATQVGRHLS